MRFRAITSFGMCISGIRNVSRPYLSSEWCGRTAASAYQWFPLLLLFICADTVPFPAFGVDFIGLCAGAVFHVFRVIRNAVAVGVWRELNGCGDEFGWGDELCARK